MANAGPKTDGLETCLGLEQRVLRLSPHRAPPWHPCGDSFRFWIYKAILDGSVISTLFHAADEAGALQLQRIGQQWRPF
jgi:hypothetical protein